MVEILRKCKKIFDSITPDYSHDAYLKYEESLMIIKVRLEAFINTIHVINSRSVICTVHSLLDYIQIVISNDYCKYDYPTRRKLLRLSFILMDDKLLKI